MSPIIPTWDDCLWLGPSPYHWTAWTDLTWAEDEVRSTYDRTKVGRCWMLALALALTVPQTVWQNERPTHRALASPESMAFEIEGSLYAFAHTLGLI